MTKKEFLQRWIPIQPIYEVKNGETVKHSMDDDLEEYGRYCAEQCWKDNPCDFEDWWNEFKTKE